MTGVDQPGIAARAQAGGGPIRPATEAEWVARAVQEVRDAVAAGTDVLVFPELFASGLFAYAPDDRPQA